MITKPTITPLEPVADSEVKPVSSADKLTCLKTLAGINSAKQSSIRDRLSALKDTALRIARDTVTSMANSVMAPIEAIIGQIETTWATAKSTYDNRNEIYQTFKKSQLDKIPKLPKAANSALNCLNKGTISLTSESMSPTSNVVTTSIANTAEAMPRSNNTRGK